MWTPIAICITALVVTGFILWIFLCLNSGWISRKEEHDKDI